MKKGKFEHGKNWLPNGTITGSDPTGREMHGTWRTLTVGEQDSLLLDKSVQNILDRAHKHV